MALRSYFLGEAETGPGCFPLAGETRFRPAGSLGRCKMKHTFRLNAFQTLTVGLALLIFVGGVLLSLPIASKQGSVSFLNALFTSASASCVTGLAVADTYSQYTFFGQLVILLLIQIGGLGFMMVSILVSFLLRRRIGLYERSILMESVGALKIGGVVRLTKHALIGTAVLESVGTLLLSAWFCPRFGFWQGLWMGIFHAVSAFCNAGFDLMGIVSPGTSFTTAAGVPLVNITIMLLIITGGLGFVLWDDVLVHKWKVREYALHTKIVLLTTAALIFGGAAAFYLLESRHAFAGLPVSQKILMSFFQSVTPRTAGFNTVDMKNLSEGGTLLTMVLMFVGAGSGSTGGGIKVSTFTVLLLSVIAYARRWDGINLFRRRLDGEVVHKAFASVNLYLTTCLVGCMVLCIQGFHLEDALFESLSAIGTVGLSRGITAMLPSASKIAIILLMFSGRVGSLSVAMAMTGLRRQRPTIKNINEKILIG